MVTRRGREWYARPPRWSSPLAILWIVVILLALLASCDLLVPVPTLLPDQAAEQTRVVATLTAISAATSLPSTPSPTQTSVLPTPTHTPVPPSPTPLPTDTVPPPTPTATLVVPLSKPTPPRPTNTPTPKPTMSPTPTDTPVLVITDWRGEYYANRDLVGAPALVRNDREVNFHWAGGSPASGLPADNFSARWTREVEYEAATYRFHALVDDGVRLWVDHEPIIDAWYDGGAHEVRANTSLTQGAHSLRVEYYEHTGDAQVRVWWERISSPSYPGWKGEYWANRDLSGDPALVRNDPAIDFNWGRKAAAPGLPDDNFAVRWSRQVNFETGIYRFQARADDGIRFYLDGNRILDEWHDSIGDTVYQVELTLTGKHQLVVEYYERGWDAWVRFWWQRLRLGPVRE